MERTNIERAVLIAGAAATFSFAELLETQAADISTPQESSQFIPFETLNPTEVLDFKAQFLQIPAFNVTDPSSDAEQISAQDTLSAWVKVSEQAANDNGFLPTDFEATVKAVVQNGKTYNVSETSLLKDVEVSIQQSVSTIKKNSLLIPYMTSDGLAVAVMSDTDGEGVETTVGSYIATIGDKSIAIPARFDKDHNPVSFMEFVSDANGEVRPQEVAVSQAIINSDQSNIRDVQDPSVVIGKIDKGTEIILVGNDADAQPVSGKNFGVLLAVTPEGKTFKIATSLVKRIERSDPPVIETTTSDYAVIPGLGMGEQDLTDPQNFNNVMNETAFTTTLLSYLTREKTALPGTKVITLLTPSEPLGIKEAKYISVVAEYITLNNPVTNQDYDVILKFGDTDTKYCKASAPWLVQASNGKVIGAHQLGTVQFIHSLKPNQIVSFLSFPYEIYEKSCPRYNEMLQDWSSITGTSNDVFYAHSSAIASH